MEKQNYFLNCSCMMTKEKQFLKIGTIISSDRSAIVKSDFWVVYLELAKNKFERSIYMAHPNSYTL